MDILFISIFLIVNQTGMNIIVHAFIANSVILLGYVPRNGIAWSKNICTLDLLMHIGLLMFKMGDTVFRSQPESLVFHL